LSRRCAIAPAPTRPIRRFDQDLASALSGKRLEELSEKRGLDLVKTPLLAIDERTPEITDPRVLHDAFKLSPNDVRVINGRDAQYIVKLVERKLSYLPKLAEIEPKVRAVLVRQMAEAKALEQATAFLKQAKDPAGFTSAATASQARDSHDGRTFSRADNSVPTIGEFHEAVQAASLLPKVPALIGRPHRARRQRLRLRAHQPRRAER